MDLNGRHTEAYTISFFLSDETLAHLTSKHLCSQSEIRNLFLNWTPKESKEKKCNKHSNKSKKRLGVTTVDNFKTNKSKLKFDDYFR